MYSKLRTSARLHSPKAYIHRGAICRSVPTCDLMKAIARATFAFVQSGRNFIHSFIIWFPSGGSALMKMWTHSGWGTKQWAFLQCVVIYCLLTFACAFLRVFFLFFAQRHGNYYPVFISPSSDTPSLSEWILVYYYYYGRAIKKVSFQFVTYSPNRFE